MFHLYFLLLQFCFYSLPPFQFALSAFRIEVIVVDSLNQALEVCHRLRNGIAPIDLAALSNDLMFVLNSP